MSRPLKDGLDYFPLDVDTDNDDKFQMLEAKYGNDGFTVIIKVMMWVYANSYYRYYGENEGLLLIKRVNVDINRINVIINDAVEWGIFDKKLFSKYKILTSNGIQKRYWGAVNRRIEVKIIKEYWIYEPDKVLVSANIKLINVNNNRKSRVEKSRVEENNIFSPELQVKFEEWIQYKKEKNQIYKPTGLNSLITTIKNNTDQYGEQAVISLITQSMAAGYQGIVWDKLQKNQYQNTNSNPFR